jgi:hypothetical protein
MVLKTNSDYFPVSINWLIFGRVRKIAKSDYLLLYVRQSVCPSVRPSVRPPARMEQLGLHWTYFH